MMNVVVPSSSECSSGCDSGWTLYLQHSTSTSSYAFNNTSFSPKKPKFEEQNLKYNNSNNNNDNGYYLYGDSQEEDLSMVSDASSGPPLLNLRDIVDDDDDNNDLGFRKGCMKSYAYETHCCNNNNDDDDFALDDTASSHIFTSKKIGGIHVQINQGAPFDRFIDYSSQGYSTTHVKVELDSKN
ncbi:hypothetical protein RND81_14G191800 [Saponaria officinalis]|uniref:Uncharacterized protein n=1 Tax=Saponaria officinalis TaxID=3572 RepID=A0AAW1GS00_SAPOF